MTGAGPPFATADQAGRDRLAEAVGLVLAALDRWALAPGGPVSGASPAALAAGVAALDPCPDDGVALAEVLDEVGAAVLAHGVRPAHPAAVAHLQCPTLVPAAAAELAIGATNQSMDSFDQAPAATYVEDHLVRWLAGLAGLPAGASGVLTSGGTASNLLGLLLAREHAGAARGAAVARDGLPPGAERWRVVCSEAAHFSVAQAAGLLGLGRGAVVAVPTDGSGAIDLAALDAALGDLAARDLTPIALVATAGTTDLGAVDPLAELADRAEARGLWLHVDAAVGGAFLLSERLAPRLAGLGRAASATVDLHKLWWQPIGASALLVGRADLLDAIRLHTPYLNPEGDEAAGTLNLVTRSLDTSRRFDALKVLVSLRAVGRRRLAAMVEHLVDLADHAGAVVVAHPDLELAAPPQTVTCVLRWRPAGADLDPATLDAVNAAIPARLWASGEVVLGRTTVAGAAHCKATFVNPVLDRPTLTALLDRVAAEGHAALADLAPAGAPA